MKGRLLLERGTTEKEFRAAIDLFKRATELDPFTRQAGRGWPRRRGRWRQPDSNSSPPAPYGTKRSVRPRRLSTSTSSYRKHTTLGLRSQSTGSGTRERPSTI